MSDLTQFIGSLPILSMITLLPLVGALGIALIPSSRPSTIRVAALRH